MSKSESLCISCGMPLLRPEDYPDEDRSKDYCVHCANEDGSMKSYDETLFGMTQFVAFSQGLDEKAARETAKELIAKQPAWRSHSY